MIAWQPLVSQASSDRYFISYRSLDETLAKLVEGEFQARGQQVWRDRRNMHSGDHWREEILRGIADCSDCIVLLTHSAAKSNEVIEEIRISLRLDKKLHVFVTFDIRQDMALRDVYQLIEGVNFVAIDAPGGNGVAATPQRFAKTVVETVLAPSLRPHPLDKSDFERIYSKRLLPASLPRTVLARYRGYFGTSSQTTLLTNFGLILAGLGDAGEAATLFRRATACGSSAISHYLLALILLEGRRPAHLRATVLDEAIGNAETAWERCKSPLIALLYGLLVWDAQRMRGPNLKGLFAEALRHLGDYACDREEVIRFSTFAPFRKGPNLPLPLAEVVQTLTVIAQTRG